MGRWCVLGGVSVTRGGGLFDLFILGVLLPFYACERGRGFVRGWFALVAA